MSQPYLLSIDMGIRTGMSVFSSEGDFLAIRSGNFGSKSGLRSAVYHLLNEFDTL